MSEIRQCKHWIGGVETGVVHTFASSDTRCPLCRAEAAESALAAMTKRAEEAERRLPKWHYTGHPADNADCRKLVTLHQDGMRWIGLRAWNGQGKFWQNGNEPELAKVHAWMDLPEIANSFWDRGVLVDMDSELRAARGKNG